MAFSLFPKTNEYSDPRWIQIFLLCTFLIFGCFFLGWSLQINIFLAGLVSSIATQQFWTHRFHLPKGTWKSAAITALGLCLLLKVNHWEWMALAGVLAISSKFLIRFSGKHIFNPSNFGILAILFLDRGWISPGQWGSGLLITTFLTICAAIILFGVNRWDVALTFIGALFILVSIHTVFYLGWPWDAVFHKFQSGTVLIFAFFMITDPKTSPDSRKGRVIWAAAIAVLSFVFAQYFYFYQAPVFALFLVSLITPILDRIFKSNPYQWKLNNLKKVPYESNA